jgi:hypothetical protein
MSPPDPGGRWPDLAGRIVADAAAAVMSCDRVYFEDTDFSGLAITPPTCAGASAAAPISSGSPATTTGH